MIGERADEVFVIFIETNKKSDNFQKLINGMLQSLKDYKILEIKVNNNITSHATNRTTIYRSCLIIYTLPEP